MARTKKTEVIESDNGKTTVLILSGHLRGKEIELFSDHAKRLIQSGQAKTI